MFIPLIFGTALIIAASAAFFSIKGIGLLFSGSFLPVVIMAASLELGKLVGVSALYRYWEKFNTLIRTYLILATIVLMGITSVGIFGFLSDAYVKAKNKHENASLVELSLTNKKEQLLSEIKFLQERLKTLNDSRIAAQKSISNKKETDDEKVEYYRYRTASVIAKDLENSGKEIESASKQLDLKNTSLQEVNNEIITVKEKLAKETDIGTFKFVSQLFGTDLDTTVRWFIFSLVFVFDPLAISLILAYNALIKKKLTM